MSAAGIMTLSVFAIGWVVLDCGAAFQFTTAFPLKLLPVTVNMKSEPPCIWLAASSDPAVRLVPLDKSEGVVKTEISWAVREHRLLCQRRLRTKTLEISPESLCGGIVPPTIAYPDIVRIESSPRVPLVGAS